MRNQKGHLAPISAAKRALLLFFSLFSSSRQAVTSTASLSSTGQSFLDHNGNDQNKGFHVPVVTDQLRFGLKSSNPSITAAVGHWETVQMCFSNINTGYFCDIILILTQPGPVTFPT